MDEYIDRNMSLKAIDEILSQTDPESEEQIGVLKCRTVIREMAASDVQEVVRCKHCKYWNKQKYSSQGKCVLNGNYPTGEWYCANGDRDEVQEIVRCKDCKYLMFSDCYGECSKAIKGIVMPDDFCSLGERRDTNDRQ